MKNARRKSEADQHELAERVGMIEELSLKVQLLVVEAEKVTQLQTKVNVKEMEWAAARVAFSRYTKALDAMTRAHASLRL